MSPGTLCGRIFGVIVVYLIFWGLTATFNWLFRINASETVVLVAGLFAGTVANVTTLYKQRN